MLKQFNKEEEEKFDELEVYYKQPNITEPLLLNTEQEEVIKSFLTASHNRLIENITKEMDKIVYEYPNTPIKQRGKNEWDGIVLFRKLLLTFLKQKDE